VALLDIGLPNVNGYDLARALRATEVTRDAVLVAVTGWGQQADRTRSAEAGFDYHLVKPVDPVHLRDLLAAVGQRPVRKDTASAAG
jgi:two-component system CheB/CheR fusion protein